jgi:hypothetical protein
MAALITTITEVKTLYPRLLNNTSKEAFLPAFESIEYKYLVPLVSLALYNDIKTKYNNDNTGLSGLTATEILLLKKMQSVIIPIAYVEELPRDIGKIGDSGPQSNIIGEHKLYSWQYKEMKQGILNQYYDAVEVLLRWLYDNKASFAMWTSSDEYTKYNSLLIKNGTDFSEQINLYQPMRTFWTMRPVVKDVQDNYHAIALGSLLTNLMGLATPTAAEKEILRVLKKAMAFFTVYRTCRMHNVRISEQGFTVVSYVGDTDGTDTIGRTQPNANELTFFMQAAEQDGYQQLTRAKRLCSELRAAGSGKTAGYDAAYDASPLYGYATPSISDRNDELTSGFRAGV